MVSCDENSTDASDDGVRVVDSTEPVSVMFNNQSFRTWRLARDKLNVMKAKAKPGSVWPRLKAVDDPSVHPDAFKLQCSDCGQSCQLRNPSKWHTKDHTTQVCQAAVAKKNAAKPSMTYSPAFMRVLLNV
jgi:hypothetical protein